MVSIDVDNHWKSTKIEDLNPESFAGVTPRRTARDGLRVGGEPSESATTSPL
jgi:hypothetical protein